MAACVEVAKESDITLVFEPEVNNVVHTARKARRLLDELQSPRLEVVFDGANIYHRGELSRQHEMLTEAIDLLGNDIALAHAKDILAKANQAAGQRRARGPASTSTTAGRAAPATSRRTWSVSCRWRDRAAARPGRARRGNRAARRSLLQLRQSSRWLAAIARADWWRLRHGYRHPSTGPAVLVSRNAGRGIRLLGNRSGLSVFGKQGTLYVMDYETLLLASPTDDPRGGAPVPLSAVE